MASWSRALVLKAAFLASVVLLILFNFYNFRLESRIKFQTPTSMSMIRPRTSTTDWAKRIRSTSHARSHNVGNNVRENDNNGSATSSTATIIISHPIISNSISSDNSTSNNNNNNNNNNEHSVSHLKHIFTSSTKIPMGKGLDGASIGASINHTSQSGQRPLHFFSFAAPNASNAVGDSGDSINSSNNSQRNKVQAVATSSSEIGIGAKQLLQKLMTSFGLNSCPPIPPDLHGPIEVDTLYEKLEIVEERLRDKLLPGGTFKPIECNAKDRVAIVIPYRDRAHHLPIFLKNIHPFLMKQQIEYGIFVVEQIADGLFNRATLMNIGFVEALKINDWDCIIFHDIDLLPMDDRNLYTCPDQPRHMSVAVDTMGFKLPYSSIFGGVSAMTVKQFRTVNGFSNSFWGWGGEDDDMSNRLKHVGYHIARYPVNIARYTMLSHRKEKANPRRYEKLVNGVKKFDTEGLNSLKYKIKYLERKILYTWILVEIRQDSGS